MNEPTSTQPASLQWTQLVFGLCFHSTWAWLLSRPALCSWERNVFTPHTIPSILLYMRGSFVYAHTRNIADSGYVEGSGIPEMKSVQSGVHLEGLLSPRTLVLKALGLVFSHAALSLGREGPFVHLSSCIAFALITFVPPLTRRFK